ncbi:MAG: hypothetical protein AABX38_03890 [Candidatus Micrarchaeota archaeon]
MDEIDAVIKIKFYDLVIARYKDLISEKETKSISDIRQKCSPYNKFIENLSKQITTEIKNYEYENNFLQALEKILEYIKTIKVLELNFDFWLSEKDIDNLKVGTKMDKSILLCSLIRSIGSGNCVVVVTKSKTNYISLEYKNDRYVINQESGSILKGEDIEQLFERDAIDYSFSDLSYEDYSE